MNRLPIRALDRKLLRDLWEMRGQALAIAAVIAAGVTMFVTFLSNFDSLRRTVDQYYEQQRLADVFANATRVPERVAARLGDLPGVVTVETRVVADVTLDVPGVDEPAAGRLISLPPNGAAALNAVLLRRGAWPDPGRPDEVVASEIFCDAHGFGPGSQVSAIVNGRRRTLTIVGVGLSPEYVYSVKPGELIPDNRRFGIFWMDRRALASAFDMDGGFNDVSLSLARDASVDDVIAGVDRVLAPYGGRGAYPQALQMSAWTLENELTQLQTFGFVTPAIFLSVAAFILNIALARALALQRPQMAALKALGYGNRDLAWHYVKWALLIAAAGSLAGIVMGWWLGAQTAELYNQYFRFPSLDYRLSAGVALGSLAGSLLAAALGARAAVARAVAVPPAEAMRPDAPVKYRQSVAERWRLFRRLPQAARMILRSLERQPVRALLSVVGLALAGAVLLIGFAFIDVMDVLIDEQFVRAMRQDVTVTFAQPRSASAVYAVQRLPGVMDVEPMRTVPARLRAGHRHRTLAVTGLPARPTLNRVVERSGRVVTLPPDGLVLSQMLAERLDVRAGDVVRVEVLEGARQVIDVPVAALVDDSLGLQAYMQIDALHRRLGEGGTVTGAALRVDPAAIPALNATLKRLPAVAGVAVQAAVISSFRQTMAENMNVMLGINVFFSGVIAFGVVYNAARVSLSERSRELASLRVLGFTRGEVAAILIGELALLTLVSLPLGSAIGYGLGVFILGIFTNEVYRLPFHVTSQTVAWTWLTVLAAAALSAWAVRRQLDRLDLVGVLKSRE
ncbi:MAG: FtsX-like permease family protein [Acidobacteria bacterium]|nr:FtsX-like permease family protein [Acidobacteriota bacterium]